MIPEYREHGEGAKGEREGSCLADPREQGGGVLAGGSLERTCPGLSDEVSFP